MKQIPVFIHGPDREPVGSLAMTEELEKLLTRVVLGGHQVTMAPSFLMDEDNAKLVEVSFVPASNSKHHHQEN
jgi:hypothetical protein